MSFIHHHTSAGAYPFRFLLPTCKGHEYIDSSLLIRVEAISNYSKLFFSDGSTIVVAKVLAWFEQLLAPRGFVRLHRSHLVNSTFIKSFKQQRTPVAVLLNNEMVSVAKRKKQAVKSSLSGLYLLQDKEVV
ncbi:MAG: LytTR family DNA-binding domain-containing protein [Bacteroidetes bacterium]|nr:LytTR family DNA-binding domain-containing protein [Bacteroidota bacterium]